MNDPKQQWSSWRSGEVLIRETGDACPIPLEIRGVMGTALDVTAVQRTEVTHEPGFHSTVWGASRQRIVLPPEFNSLRLYRRSSSKAFFSGLGGWRVTRLADHEVEPVAGRMSGEGPWVLRIDEGSTKSLNITWNKGDYAGTLTLFGPGSGPGKELSKPNHTHETITVTGPGYLLLDAQHWSLTTD
ncbi:hypothetical protein ACFQ7F_42550 [Streptomyces sp. NPDC056486]|uniref:hypothetical protein n=1 Tax=Streptomyces sp. NPDC056486 TaxID=3345835 RepID=UPI0036CDC308